METVLPHRAHNRANEMYGTCNQEGCGCSIWLSHDTCGCFQEEADSACVTCRHARSFHTPLPPAWSANDHATFYSYLKKNTVSSAAAARICIHADALRLSVSDTDLDAFCRFVRVTADEAVALKLLVKTVRQPGWWAEVGTPQQVRCGTCGHTRDERRYLKERLLIMHCACGGRYRALDALQPQISYTRAWKEYRTTQPFNLIAAEPKKK